MTLATLVFGVFLIAKGVSTLLLREGAPLARAKELLRNRTVDTVLHVLASAWFLWIVANLGKSDFGDYKVFLFLGFFIVAVGSWLYVKDFLGVRAACALYMMVSWVLLKAAFGHYEVPARLFMVTPIYFGLVFALYFSAAPYRVRDIMEWLAERPVQRIVLGSSLCVYGAWLLLVPVLFY